MRVWGRLPRGRSLLVLAGIVLAVFVATAPLAILGYYAGCAVVHKPTFIIQSGSKGGLYQQLGSELAAVLNRGDTGIRFEDKPSRGSNDNVQAIGKQQAHLALAQDGLDASDGVRALVRLYNSPYHLVVRRSANCKDFEDMLQCTWGKVFFGSANSGTRTITEQILTQYGMSLTSFSVTGDDWSFDRAADALLNGEIVAAAFLVGYNASALKRLAKDDRFELLAINRSKGLVTAYPYLEYTIIETSTYASAWRFPSKPIETIATRELLVASTQVTERQAYLIVEALFQSSAKVVAHFPLLTQLERIEPERNFYYPLHPGASAFYRRSGIPAFLSPEKVLAAVLQFISIISFVIIAVRRKRLKQLINRIDDIAAQPALSVFAARAALAQVQQDALQQYKEGKLREEWYALVKEAVAAALQSLAGCESMAPQTQSFATTSHGRPSIAASANPHD